MKKTIIAAAVLVALTACNKNIIETASPEAGYGTINLGVSTDTEMVVTKGITSETLLTGYNIILKKDGVALEGWPKEYADAMDESLWKVPAGNYSVYVENIKVDEVYDKNADRGEVRVAGETAVTVYPGISADCPVQCHPKNSKVSFLYTEKFAEVFQLETAAVKVTDGTKECTAMEMQAVAALDKATLDAAFYEPTELTWTLNIKNKNGAGDDKTYSSTVTTKEATWTHVTFDTGETSSTINVIISVNGEITETETITATLDPMGGVEKVE